jgi:hypothetical protein
VAKSFRSVTGGRPSSFHDLSVGEALALAPKERENSGGGKFPSQISRRKDQPATKLGGQAQELYPPLADLEQKKRLRRLSQISTFDHEGENSTH